MSHNTTANIVLDSTGFWGPVTSTLDWCEANYQFSRFIAEAANSVSNIFGVALACYGAAQSIKEDFPRRILVGWMGFALVGIGSFIFHATLLYEAQLMDELPMIYVASYCAAILFDTTRGYNLRGSNTLQLGIIFIILNVAFTWSYYVSRNPVYHQLVFATLMFINLFRTAYLLKIGVAAKRIPSTKRACITRLCSTGAGVFIFGFGIWNLDNIFCARITQWKQAIGWPAAFFLEGHSWWHVLTAIGTYLILIGNTYLTLCIKEDHNNFIITKILGIPRIERVTKTKIQ